MKKFNRKSSSQICLDAEAAGWEADKSGDYATGGDWFWLRDMENRFLQVLYNAATGCFFVYAPSSDKPIATEASEHLEGKEWYDELLNLLYLPHAGEAP